MNTVTLQPLQKQVYQVNPQQSHSRISVRRVLYAKLCRWIDRTPGPRLLKTTIRLLTPLLVLLLYIFPSFTIGILTSAATWNGFRIPIACAIFFSVLNAKRLWIFSKRITVRHRGSNHHTFHGIPVGEFAAWLMEAKSFKRDEAIRKWGLSQGTYHKIAEELDKHGVLMRGENNARVLREITMEDLVRQLRDDFPLAWSEERQMFYEKNGTLERWAINQDFQRKKLEEETERKERKLQRIEKRIEKVKADPFAQVFGHSSIACQ